MNSAPLQIRYLLLPPLLLLLGPSVMSQQPSPIRTPPVRTDSPQERPVPTLKVAVRRVVVDVTVTDAKGKPIAGLTPADFTIYEDNVAQQIRSFEAHKVEPTNPVELPKLPPNTFANLSTASTNSPATVVLYDLLNTPRDAQPYAHQEFLAFLRKRTTHGPVAIFVLTDRLHMLQGFTEDDAQLIAAMSQPAGKGYRSSLLQNGNEATQTSDQMARTEGNQNGADAQRDPAFQQIAGMLQHMETMETSYLTDRRVDITVDALQEIARFLIGVPGRKNLLWLSGSFPSGIVPDAERGGRDSFEVTRNYSKSVVEATDLLTLCHVAVYPVDVRGLQVNPMFSAGTNQVFEPGQGKDARAVRNFAQSQTAEHTTMTSIADSTGGRAFFNTNGLAEAELTALEDSSLYYTLTYAPTNAAYDGKLRRVRIESTRPGYQLAYRRRYFADDLDNVARNEMDNPDDGLAVSLRHGGPGSHELFFEAQVQAQGEPVQATPEQLADLSRYEAMAVKKGRKAAIPGGKPLLLQKYVVQYVLLPRQLEMAVDDNAVRRDHLEFAFVAYDEEGLATNGMKTRLDDVIHPDRWGEMLQGGYHVPIAVYVPVTAKFLRLAVKDAGDNRTGSLEISLPLAKQATSDASTGPAATHR